MSNLESIIKTKQLSAKKLEELAQLFPEEYAEMEAKKKVNVHLSQFITTYDFLEKKLKSEVRKLSEVDDPVIIIGPTGTGKELIAKALHGDRAGPFVDINCAGLPESLVESELFGHVKGAFTGAGIDKVGLLQTAFEGTVFLDEIGELPLSIQAKILRAIQEKQIRRVGDSENIKIKCRFVAATHRELKEDMVAKGTFREDLYWRLGRIILRIPGLKDRAFDIVPIVKQLIIQDRSKYEYEIEDIEEFCEELIEKRTKLTGNVRQLQNIIRNYHVLGRKPEL
jgi:transcriptional regulator with PAS, ATPase and Fis domain